jgi:hypothetical protein
LYGQIDVSVPGSDSIQLLHDTLESKFESGALIWAWETGPGIDAIGWKLKNAPQYLFSISTNAGELPTGRYDLMISIISNGLDHGDIVVDIMTDFEGVCEVVAKGIAGNAI